MKRLAVLPGLAVLGACAGGPAELDGRTATAGYAAEGLAVAEARCAGCHSIAAGPSPRPMAPPFRVLGVRFNPITWERAMAQIAAGGHDEMPAVVLSDPDVRRLKAYIDSLR